MKLYLGDSVEILPKIDDQSIDCVISDPPYIFSMGSSMRKFGYSGSWADLMNMSHWFATWYKEVNRVLKDNGSFWTFCNWKTFPLIQKALSDAKMGASSLIVWNKMIPGLGGKKGLRPFYELIVLSPKNNFSIPDRKIGDIWDRKWQSHHGETDHPAEKPVDLIEKIIKVCALEKNSIILDPFMGSGTTGVAALNNGMRFIGIEMNEEWYFGAEKRLSKIEE